jgi:hypothetical protein
MFYQTGKIKSMFALVRQRFQQSVIHTTHLVKPSSNIDRTGLNDGINDLGQGGQEVRRVDFRVEEDLGCQESLVSDVHVVTLQHMSDEDKNQLSRSGRIIVFAHPKLTLPVTLCSPVNLAKYL